MKKSGHPSASAGSRPPLRTRLHGVGDGRSAEAPTKWLLIVPNFKTPAYAIVAAGLGRALSGRGTVQVAVGDGAGPYRSFVEAKGMEILRAGGPRGLSRHIGRRSCDVVHYHFACLDRLDVARAVAGWDGFFLLTFQDWRGRPPVRLVRRADRITCVSRDVRKRLSACYPWTSRKSCVIPNGYEPMDLAVGPRPGKAAARPYILSVARILPDKGLDVLLFAFARLRRSFPGLRLMVIGDGIASCRRWFRGLIGRLGLASSVVWHRRLSHAQVGGRLKDSLFFVLPSRWESFGMAALEAMAAGKAVIATKTGGLPDLISHGRHGMLVPAGDVRALVNGMRALLRSAGRRRALAGAAARKAKNFAWRFVAQRYRQAASSGPRGRSS